MQQQMVPSPQGMRIAPVGPTSAYKSYIISTPSDASVVSACEDVGCLARRNGWVTTVDESTDLGKAQASYIRWQSGRTFRERKLTMDGLTIFEFESGQRCFAQHKTRPEIFGVRVGDWRGNPTGQRRIHANGADWVEDFGLHQQKIADLIQQG